MPADAAFDARRRTVRRRAFANLVLALRDEARGTAGRFAVAPSGTDAVVLRYAGVRTLVRRDGAFALAERDFVILLACPALWPFARAEALVPVIVEPDDFAHPNSDGRRLCLDLEGVLPERIPALLYDNVRVHAFRLDHCVDRAAAAFVRAHLDDFPADRTPLGAEAR